VKPHAAAPRVDRALAHLERRQAIDRLAELRGQPRGDRGRIVGVVELELDGVIALAIDQLVSSSST